MINSDDEPLNWFSAVLAVIGMLTVATLPIRWFGIPEPWDKAYFIAVIIGCISLNRYLKERRKRD